MPPKKESVVYPASKRKAPPFKPQRPSKVPRIPTTDSERSIPNKPKPAAPTQQRQVIQVRDDDGDSDDDEMNGVTGEGSDSDEELDDNPLASKPKQVKAKKPTRPTLPKQNPLREVSPMSISSQQSSNASPGRPPDSSNLPPPPSQGESPPVIPQPLLVRLLHEHYADNNTKIDKQAIQVLQKYFQIFIQEAIARAKEQKKQRLERVEGEASTADEVDASWLELEDLDKVAAEMLLDF